MDANHENTDEELVELPDLTLDEQIIEELEYDDTARGEGTIRFTLPDVRKITEIATLSPSIQVRNFPWKIIITKRKRRTATRMKEHEGTWTLGYFLQCNSHTESSPWSCNASARLKIIPWNSNTPVTERELIHTFCNKENDWGFTNFMTMEELVDPGRGFVNPHNFSLQFEVDITADLPNGIRKNFTKYVGLKNQGATCYINSLLQMLFFTNKFRKAIYLIPTERDEPVRSVPLALQRLFYNLQSRNKSVGTKELTKSFGWEAADSFEPQDAQEFCRVLLENIDMNMKGTSVESTISHLFEGKMLSFIRCRNVEFESSREETFMDVQLNVKNRKDVYESLDDYVGMEVLDGDNKYDTGDHGLQEAEKGVAFLSFPPVLHLQLKRSYFDPVRKDNVKVNDRFEFPERLDLAKYIMPCLCVPTVYFLHAVLVHSGDNHGGHYVIYINPTGDGKWCKFNDDVVIPCPKNEAIKGNYGGSDEFAATSASMLVYIAESRKDEILQPVTENDVPGYLIRRLAEERLAATEKIQRLTKQKMEKNSLKGIKRKFDQPKEEEFVKTLNREVHQLKHERSLQDLF